MDLGKSIRHALIALITTTALAGASATIFSTPPQIVQASETATISPLDCIIKVTTQKM